MSAVATVAGSSIVAAAQRWAAIGSAWSRSAPNTVSIASAVRWCSRARRSGGEIVEHRLAHERVAEAEVADAARHDDARHDGRVEVVQAAVGGESGGVGEEAHVDLGSDHRADGQHVERPVGQPCQAAAHHVADGLRYRLGPARHRRRAGARW